MVRRVLALAAALLAAFHVWIFADQLWAGELSDPSVFARWAIAAGLVAALIHLRRRNLSIVRSRPAVAVWLMAALLHGPALAREIENVAPSMPEVVTAMARTIAVVGTIGTLLLLWLLRRRRTHAPAWRQLAAFTALTPTTVLSASFPLSAPRPPPLTSIHR